MRVKLAPVPLVRESVGGLIGQKVGRADPLGQGIALFGELHQQARDLDVGRQLGLFPAKPCPFGGVMTQHKQLRAAANTSAYGHIH